MAKRIKIEVPDNAECITLGQYIDFFKEVNELEDKDKTTVDRLIMKYFTSVPEDLIDKVPGKVVANASLAVNSILMKDDYPLINRFEISGKEFGFIPELDESSLKEWIDIDEYLPNIDHYDRLMAVLFRPVVRKQKVKKIDTYAIEEYNGTKEWADTMRLMPLNIALGGVRFFYVLGIDLLSNIPSYLEKQVAGVEAQCISKILERSGNGIEQFTSLLEEIQPDKKLF